MAEILDYQDIGKGPPLGRALEEIGRQVGQGDSKYDEPKSKVKSLCNRPRRLNFVTADVTELITTGLGGLNDELAAGVSILTFSRFFLLWLPCSPSDPLLANRRSVEL